MATIQVTQDTPTSFVKTANRDLTVTVSLVGVGFSVYCRVTSAGERIDIKVIAGQQRTFNILRNDDVDAYAMGTGTVTVTTA